MAKLTHELDPEHRDACLENRDTLRMVFNDIKNLYCSRIIREATEPAGVALSDAEKTLLDLWLQVSEELVCSLNEEIVQ